MIDLDGWEGGELISRPSLSRPTPTENKIMKYLRNTDGSLKLDAHNDPIPDPNWHEPPPALTEAEVRRREEAARSQANAEVERVRAELAARDEKDRQRALASLPPEQQTNARLSQLEQEMARRDGIHAQEMARANDGIRQVGLLAYRERAARDVPQDVAEFVIGNSEEEIDRAATNAFRTGRNQCPRRTLGMFLRFKCPMGLLLDMGLRRLLSLSP
jgi:hypothetical protein